MKKIKILFLCSIILITACNHSNKKNILGNWKLTKVQLDDHNNDFNETILTFNEDGKVTQRLIQKNEKSEGIYEFNSMENAIIVEFNDVRDSMVILKFTKQTLQLKSEKGHVFTLTKSKP